MSTNILGESFDKYVKDQIITRQKKLGETERSPELLTYLNNKTAWLRLSSAVKIDSKKARELLPTNPSSIEGNELAKKFILYSGVTNSNQQIFSGVLDKKLGGNTINIESKAYGTGDLDRGLRPMPGLEKASIKSYNRGSLRYATISIKAFNRSQFLFIDTLYMRPGYTILLEWGHTLYYQSSGNNATLNRFENFNTLPFRYFFSSKPDQYKILDQIEEQRKITSGNYDGFFGKIVNFSWSYDSNDGSYNIVIKAISIGSVIESLKMNVKLPEDVKNISNDKANGEEPPKVNEAVIAGGDVSYIHRELLLLENKLTSTNAQISKNGNIRYSVIPEENEPINKCIKIYSGGKGKDQFYMTLFSLLKLIEEKTLLYSKRDDTSMPLFKIFRDIDKNFCLSNKFHISADPRVCIIPFTFENEAGNQIEFYRWKEILGDGFKPQNSSEYVGRLMNIYINHDYIRGTIESNLDEKTGKVSLISFLESLMNGVQRVLGNINKFTVTYDHDRNLIKIVDDNPLSGLDKSINIDSTVIKLEGVVPGGYGSFVTNIGMDSEITNEMASMIAIGAQANSNSIGENSTMFSKWNKGLTDRVIPEKLDIYSTENNLKEDTTAETAFISSRNKLASLIRSVYFYMNFGDDSTFESFINLNSEVQNYRMGHASSGEQPSHAPIGFIPLNLSLTMDGISGMKMYQRYTVEDNILPPSYPENLDFIIRGIDHDIDGQWTTTISSLSINSNKKVKTKDPKLENRRGEAKNPTIKDEPSPAVQNETFKEKLLEISRSLNINPNWLLGVMYSESKLDPKSVNKQRGDSNDPSIRCNKRATGLIQFMPDTAKGLGTSNIRLYNMSATQQLTYVEKYFKSLGIPDKKQAKSVYDLYILTFFPIAFGKPDDFVLKSKDLSAASIVKSNKALDLNFNNEITVGEFKRWFRENKLPSGTDRDLILSNRIEYNKLAFKV